MKKLMRVIAAVMACVCFITCLDATAFAASSLKKPVVSISIASKSNPTLKLSWDKVDGATDYYIYRRATNNGKLSYLAKTSSLSYSDKGLKTDKIYYYKVKAVTVKNGSVTAKSSTSKLVYKAVVNLKATSGISASAKSDSSVNVSFNAVSGATRYYVYYSAKKNSGYKSVKTTETSCLITGLKPSTKYYFKVRAAKVIDGKAFKGSTSSIIKTKTEAESGRYLVDFVITTTADKNGTFKASISTIALNKRISTAINTVFDMFDDLKKLDGLKLGAASVRYSEGRQPAGGDRTDTGFPQSLTVSYSPETLSLGVTTSTAERRVSEQEYFKQIKKKLDGGELILAAIKDKTPTDKTGWWSVCINTEPMIELSDSYKYGVLCGYTDTDYLVHNPYTGKLEKYSISDAFSSIKCLIYLDCK